MTVKTKILRSLPVGPDKETHIRSVRVDGREIIDIRDFVPSLKRYGRGIALTPDSFRRIVEEDGPEILDYMWPKGSPGPGQRRML